MIFKSQVDELERRWKQLRIQCFIENLKPGVKSNASRKAERSAMEAYFNLAMKYDVQTNNFIAMKKLKEQKGRKELA